MKPNEVQQLAECSCLDDEIELVERLILAERERCAKVAEAYHRKTGGGGGVAAAIREEPK